MLDLWARPGQLLYKHLENVSNLASLFASKYGGSEMLKLAGGFHDFGKVSDEFQNMLAKNNSKKDNYVQHSIFGAKRIFTDVSLPHLAEILGNIIASHHGALNDNISPEGDTPLTDRINAAELFEPMPNNPTIDLDILQTEFEFIFDKINAGEKYFGVSMLIKLMYSCLVDADRLDAYLHESGSRYVNQPTNWQKFHNNLTEYLKKFNSQTEMDLFRKKISEKCEIAGLRERGVYKLEVPTGGGKTLSSLRFALVHANKHKLDHIIYIIPYLSILSQAAIEIREALKADELIVLEHHSGFLPDNPEYYKLQTDRWDAPIILTTQVQFLESIFSAKGSDLRKFHNMVNSVLIFDEAQSLPVKCVHLYNGAINFLHDVCGSTVLLCTATQPLFDTVERKLRFSENPSIVHCGTISKRVDIKNSTKPSGYTYPELAGFIMEKHVNSTLVIVNTKSAAKALYGELVQSEISTLHLSTNMCAAHRDEVIAKLRCILDKKEPVICISTQLIEAGVNISFECVIRDIAGLDSVFQAAGRCNRHGEFGETKDVFVVNIHGENLDKLPDIKEGAQITRRFFDEERGEDIDAYYEHYFHARRKIMDYPIKNSGNIYDLLSGNVQGKNAYKNRKDKQNIKPPVMISAIRSAADAFYVIDRGRKDIIVPYGNALEIVECYCKADTLEEKRNLLRKLGKYSVSLYRYQVEALSHALYPRGESCELTVLDAGFYNPNRGVDIDGHHEFLYS